MEYSVYKDEISLPPKVQHFQQGCSLIHFKLNRNSSGKHHLLPSVLSLLESCLFPDMGLDLLCMDICWGLGFVMGLIH